MLCLRYASGQTDRQTYKFATALQFPTRGRVLRVIINSLINIKESKLIFTLTIYAIGLYTASFLLRSRGAKQPLLNLMTGQKEQPIAAMGLINLW